MMKLSGKPCVSTHKVRDLSASLSQQSPGPSTRRKLTRFDDAQRRLDDLAVLSGWVNFSSARRLGGWGRGWLHR